MKTFESERISILLPVYNGGESLRKSIKSILNQTYSNFELIAVDDGSDDDTREILHQFSQNDPRVKVFEKRHSGIVDTLNVGLEQCRGRLIVRHDGGDLSHRERIEALRSAMDRNTGLSCIFTKNYVLDEEYRVRALYPLRSIKNMNKSIDENKTLFSHPSLIYRKDDVLRAGGYQKVAHNEDTALWKKMRSLGMNFGFIDKPLYAIIKSKVGISGEHIEEQLRTTLALFGENGDDKEIARQIANKKLRERIVYSIPHDDAQIFSIRALYYAVIIKTIQEILLMRFKRMEQGFDFGPSR
ncbi:MAG TPA: glycosyltransferase family 2 protein [Bacteroidota bacterium]|nr:glycosyltransferase family 2 protein [Bacteroidota bacterium]